MVRNLGQIKPNKLLWRKDETENLTIKNIKFNVEKPFKSKVTTTGSTRSKLLHYTNKRVKIIFWWIYNKFQKKTNNSYANK